MSEGISRVVKWRGEHLVDGLPIAVSPYGSHFVKISLIKSNKKSDKYICTHICVAVTERVIDFRIFLGELNFENNYDIYIYISMK
jgi:hypothetical protein